MTLSRATSFDPIKHPRRASGEFAEVIKTPPAIALVPRPASPAPASLASWSPDTSVPYPQANDLEKVILVADAVEHGAVTADAIAEALGVPPREGGYLANAAAYLRVVEVRTDDGLSVYSMTPWGAELNAADDDARADLAASMVERLPDVATIDDDGESALVARLRRDDYSTSTAKRRAAAMRCWMEAARDRRSLAAAMATEGAAAATRMSGAAQTATRQREEARARIAAQSKARPDIICTTCFMAVPTTGRCDECA